MAPDLKGLDWPGLMRVGFHDLRLSPAAFWALTPLELSILLGAEAKAKPLTRARLDELAAAFPDIIKERNDEPGRGSAGTNQRA